MKYLSALVLTLVLGIAAALPTKANAGPIIYRAGPYDRWAESGYMLPRAWGYDYAPGYYNYNSYSYYYYNPGYAAPYYYNSGYYFVGP